MGVIFTGLSNIVTISIVGQLEKCRACRARGRDPACELWYKRARVPITALPSLSLSVYTAFNKR